MSYLVANPEDRFSRDVAHILNFSKFMKYSDRLTVIKI